MAEPLKLSSKTLYKYKAQLHKKPSNNLINVILTKISKDNALSTILTDYNNIGICSRKENIDALKTDCWNFPLEAINSHFHKIAVNIRKTLKQIKTNNYRWFLPESSQHITPRICNRVINRAIFIKKFIKPSQCIHIIISDFETYSDDDVSNDVVGAIKPYVALAENQEWLGNADNNIEKQCLKYLGFFIDWYGSFEDYVYYPATTSIQPKMIAKDGNPFKLIQKGTEKVHFKAQDNRLSVDAMQQFLRPVVYMLSIPVHHQPHFKYHIFG